MGTEADRKTAKGARRFSALRASCTRALSCAEQQQFYAIADAGAHVPTRGTCCISMHHCAATCTRVQNETFETPMAAMDSAAFCVGDILGNAEQLRSNCAGESQDGQKQK